VVGRLIRDFGRAVLVLCAALGAAACDEDVVGVVTPTVEVSPLHLDFGTVSLGQEKRLSLKLTNRERVPAELGSIATIDDCEDCFLAIDPPSVVEGQSEIELVIRFRAVRVAVATGTVTIRPKEPTLDPIEVTMIGRGSDDCRPDIEVQPQAVDFGFVPAGGIGVSSFVIRSTGSCALLIDRLSFDPPDAPFEVTTATPTPERAGVLAPGAQASVGLRANVPSSVTGTVTARLLIETNLVVEKNVPGRIGVVAVPLEAQANLPPLAVVGEDQTVEPWSRATLDGARSYDQDNPPDDPLTYRWEIITKPEGSTTVLEHARTPAPSFWVDLAGRYEVSLIVTDALGLESQNRAVTVIEALPTNAVRIELIWDHPDSDLDLHLIRDNGTFCDCATDVHYRDCGREPNWFPQSPGANPRLDIDDRSGFGPENINLDGDGPERFIPNGRYTIAVHYYASNRGISTWPTSVSNAVVRVYLYGLLAAELSKPLENDGDLWIAGKIQWPERTVQPDGTVLSGQICSIF
jgi:hypothetical protein